MVRVRLAWLLEATGSVSEPATCALNTVLPGAVWVTTTETVVEAALARLPRLQLMPLVNAQAPAEEDAETRMPEAGICAVNAMLVEVDGPELTMVAV